MGIGELIFFIIVTIGLVLNFAVFVTQRAKKKRNQPILFEVSTRYFVIYIIGYVIFALFAIFKAYI